MEYTVHRHNPTQKAIPWTEPAWDRADSITLSNHMGQRPSHFPKVLAKLLFCDQAIHVAFRVRDQYVCATAKMDQDSVCIDSCVEFFFTPHAEIKHGYFNFEINCGGTILFHFQPEPRKGHPIAFEDLARVDRYSSLPRRLDSELHGPVDWEVSARIPFDLISEYFPVKIAEPSSDAHSQIVWRANLFKCADNSSHPHWLTWAKVDHPTPDFHRPQDFGTLRLACS